MTCISAARLKPVFLLALSLVLASATASQSNGTQRAAASSPAKESCANDEVHRLDFLLGDWVSATADLALETGSHGSGVNHFEAVLGGCAIVQRRYEEKDGKKLFDSMVIWAYDAALNRLREFVISDDLNAQVYEGIWEDDGWTFYRDRIGSADQMWLLRVRYVQTPKGFNQTAELTKDRGKTWIKASSTDYIRKPPLNP
jgi:hypothetical protein